MFWETSLIFFFLLVFVRKLCRVQATILQDDEQKVFVEESLELKNFPGDEEKGSHGRPPENRSSSALERWVIKFEQSVNIFLTVFFLFLNFLFKFSISPGLLSCSPIVCWRIGILFVYFLYFK